MWCQQSHTESQTLTEEYNASRVEELRLTHRSCDWRHESGSPFLFQRSFGIWYTGRSSSARSKTQTHEKLHLWWKNQAIYSADSAVLKNLGCYGLLKSHNVFSKEVNLCFSFWGCPFFIQILPFIPCFSTGPTLFTNGRCLFSCSYLNLKKIGLSIHSQPW